jgi:hypothetical protein
MDKKYHHITEEIMYQYNDDTDIKTLDAEFACKLSKKNKLKILEKKHKDQKDAITKIIDDVFDDDYLNRMIVKHIKSGLTHISLEPLRYLYSYNGLPGELLSEKQRTQEKEIRSYINKRQNNSKNPNKIEHLEESYQEFIMVRNFHHYLFKFDLSDDLTDYIKEYFITKFNKVYKNYVISFQYERNLTNDLGKFTEILISWNTEEDIKPKKKRWFW